MNTKSVIAIAILTLIGFSSCGPAAEDRNEMHRRAKIIADSMANLITVAMKEAEMPAFQPARPAPPTATQAGESK